MNSGDNLTMNKNRILSNRTEIVSMKAPSNLPFNISNDLDNYSKIYITRGFNPFRIFHCFEFAFGDYTVFGDTEDGDKKILFTAKTHSQCCHCCDSCVLTCCFCDYVCCNRIMFQVDYTRNNKNFFTQGFNLQKGCYFCQCHTCLTCCSFCCTYNRLILRENTNPDDPDMNIGVKMGQTITNKNFCFCQDKTVEYNSENGTPGHTLRLNCCDIFKNSLCCSCTRCQDVEIDIENSRHEKVGRINMPNGCCSSKSPNMCFLPGHYFEINFPQKLSSMEKFLIIAEAIHFDLDTTLII